jgi:hypothetical protein
MSSARANLRYHIRDSLRSSTAGLESVGRPLKTSVSVANVAACYGAARVTAVWSAHPALVDGAEHARRVGQLHQPVQHVKRLVPQRLQWQRCSERRNGRGHVRIVRCTQICFNVHGARPPIFPAQRVQVIGRHWSGRVSNACGVAH